MANFVPTLSGQAEFVDLEKIESFFLKRREAYELVGRIGENTFNLFKFTAPNHDSSAFDAATVELDNIVKTLNKVKNLNTFEWVPAGDGKLGFYEARLVPTVDGAVMQMRRLRMNNIITKTLTEKELSLNPDKQLQDFENRAIAWFEVEQPIFTKQSTIRV